MRSLGEERTGDVTGVSVSNWLMSPPGDFAVNSPGDPPKSGLPAIALAPPPGDAPPLTGVPWNPNTSNSGTSLYRLCVEFRVTSASFSSPKDLPSVRRMDLRLLDFAAETCSFVRSEPYRDGGGARTVGFFGDVDRGDLAIARTSSSPKETLRFRRGDSGLASSATPAFFVFDTFDTRAAHRSLLIPSTFTGEIGRAHV